MSFRKGVSLIVVYDFLNYCVHVLCCHSFFVCKKNTKHKTQVYKIYTLQAKTIYRQMHNANALLFCAKMAVKQKQGFQVKDSNEIQKRLNVREMYEIVRFSSIYVKVFFGLQSYAYFLTCLLGSCSL